MLNHQESANVAALVWQRAQRHPGRPCVTDLDANGGARTVTYGELTQRVAALASGLAADGVTTGDRIALLLRNSMEFVETFLAIASLGAVAVPLNVRLREADFLYMLADSGSSVLVTESGLLAGAPGIRSLPNLKIVYADAVGLGSLDELCRRSPPLDGPVYRTSEDVVSLMYTSGTTGAPKAVMLTHRSWRCVSDVASEVLGFAEDEVVLHVAPLTHGAGFLLLPTLAAGGHNLLCRSFDAARTLKLLDSARVTGLFLVPSMIRMLLDGMAAGWSVPDGFRWLYYAGSPINPGTLREAATALDGRLVQSFGQMESPMFVTILDRDDHARVINDPASPVGRSAGRVLPGVELAVLDNRGNELSVANDGEIVVRAPQTMAGYRHRPEETAAALAGGWLHTGDIGHLDKDGYLYVVDRLKDMIVTGGSNVYAREVEEVLVALPEIREAAVIGLPDRLWGEAVTAVLVPSGSDRDTAKVIDACREMLASYRVPKHVRWVKELPRNAYGKILKRQLREAYASEEAANTSPPAEVKSQSDPATPLHRGSHARKGPSPP